MTFREAYQAFCDFRNGKLVYDDTLEDAMRIYMNKADDLLAENAKLSVDLRRTKEKLCKALKLKEKYYNKLKEHRKG